MRLMGMSFTCVLTIICTLKLGKGQTPMFMRAQSTQLEHVTCVVTLGVYPSPQQKLQSRSTCLYLKMRIGFKCLFIPLIKRISKFVLNFQLGNLITGK